MNARDVSEASSRSNNSGMAREMFYRELIGTMHDDDARGFFVPRPPHRAGFDRSFRECEDDASTWRELTQMLLDHAIYGVLATGDVSAKQVYHALLPPLMVESRLSEINAIISTIVIIEAYNASLEEKRGGEEGGRRRGAARSFPAREVAIRASFFPRNATGTRRRWRRESLVFTRRGEKREEWGYTTSDHAMLCTLVRERHDVTVIIESLCAPRRA